MRPLATLLAITIAILANALPATRAQSNISVIVNTNPTGRSFSVDGTNYTSTHTFSWVESSSHTIATTSLQPSGITRYLWSNWSDGGAISHTVAPAVGTTYTANFSTQHLLTMNSPATMDLSPATGYRDAGEIVQISATPHPGYSFTGWTGTGLGSYTGPNNPAFVTMNGPIVETAVAYSSVTVTVTTIPPGLSIAVDGTTLTAPQTVAWASGSTHNIATTSPQAGGPGTQYLWNNWSDGLAISHNVGPTSNTTFTAFFRTQFYLTTSAGLGGTVSPASAFQDSGGVVQISAAPIPNLPYEFESWTGSGAGSYTGATNPATVTMLEPVSETAAFYEVTGIGDGPAPTALALDPGVPNPVVTRTTFEFALPRGGKTTLRVYDVGGREIATLADEVFAPGRYHREWLARDSAGRVVPSSIYYIRLENGSDVRLRRIVVIR